MRQEKPQIPYEFKTHKESGLETECKLKTLCAFR